MIKNILLYCLISITIYSNAQNSVKEITKTFPNGQPMFIDYLDVESLKKIKTEIFNEDGLKIFSMQFNPKNGKPDGDFFDLINKGSYKNGVLNCMNCMLVSENTPKVFTYNYNRQNTKITKGDVVEGRFIGRVVTILNRERTYNAIDWESSRQWVAAGLPVGFRDVKTYGTGEFIQDTLTDYIYDNNGLKNGEIILQKDGYVAKIFLKEGIVQSYVSRNEQNMLIDSISNQQNLWVINSKFVKNNGFVVFKNVDDFLLDIREDERKSNPNYKIINDNEKKIILVGGIQNYYNSYYKKNMKFNTGGSKLALSNDGIYYSHLNITPYIFDIIESLSGLSIYDVYNYLMYNNMSIFNTYQKLHLTSNEYVSSNKFYYQRKLDEWPATYKELLGLMSWMDSTVEFNGRFLTSNALSKLPYEYIKGKRMTDYNFKIQRFLTTLNYTATLLPLSRYLNFINNYISNKTEIHKIYVWDAKKSDYVEVDFNLLLSRSSIADSLIQEAYKKNLNSPTFRQKMKDRENYEYRLAFIKAMKDANANADRRVFLAFNETNFNKLMRTQAEYNVIPNIPIVIDSFNRYKKSVIKDFYDFKYRKGKLIFNTSEKGTSKKFDSKLRNVKRKLNSMEYEIDSIQYAYHSVQGYGVVNEIYSIFFKTDTKMSELVNSVNNKNILCIDNNKLVVYMTSKYFHSSFH